ncbi:GPW/gp25 family protein [Oceanospirillum linum]|uniref:IraD/Gp25-like domain-containing protein n=1 Tax=Oceanospirillum linum TaxID=966 RepID=A0A1T1HD64_OCELI|nr:GPW/gp25 family protein [Oceanospirillum linum]OOV87765.1 hypothetical protein BTA35_0207090 [Oceanospirillum linum]SEG13065.1 type VI secretion system lysozyme-like protein [Oleiphilus messinensis]SMP10059.1 type VI secretion system lysozyme-like protein [Oceanospirillum linum]
MKAGLLRRLNDDVLQGDIEALAALLALQLQDLLNVRAGSCLSNLELGLPAISPVQLQGDTVQSQRLAKVIQLQVSRFEPRLQQSEVVAEGDKQGVMLFTLKSFFEQRYERYQAKYQIRIDSDSRVAVLCTGLQSIGPAHR